LPLFQHASKVVLVRFSWAINARALTTLPLMITANIPIFPHDVGIYGDWARAFWRM
jgi:hypothetical protein